MTFVLFQKWQFKTKATHHSSAPQNWPPAVVMLSATSENSFGKFLQVQDPKVGTDSAVKT